MQLSWSPCRRFLIVIQFVGLYVDPRRIYRCIMQIEQNHELAGAYTMKFRWRKRVSLTASLLAVGLVVSAATQNFGGREAVADDDKTQPVSSDGSEKKMAIATLGGGCFWCVEGAMEQLKGVGSVVSGYEGGHVVNPTYEQVCGKRTGHIEVCQIHFDPAVISFDELLEVFFKIHDPTSRDRQGADAGPQYRSVIFFHDEEQEKVAKAHIRKLDEGRTLGRKIVTEVLPTETFYVAEEYHQDYFAKNPFAGYCQAVVKPKVDKVQKEFGDKVKK